MTVEGMAEMIGRAHGAALDDVTRALWAGVATGQIGDADAASLSAAIEVRKPLGRPGGAAKPPRAITLRPAPQRCPDRIKALERTRRWAAAGRMPPSIACKFTMGEQAALAVIAFDVAKRKFCDKAIGAIAALAGISESTVKRAIRQAKALGFVTVQERRLSRYRNDTNIVRIIAKAWVAWIDLRGSGGGGQRRTSTNISSLGKEAPKAVMRLQEGPSDMAAEQKADAPHRATLLQNTGEPGERQDGQTWASCILCEVA
jgi:hypothetical protein